MSNIKKFLDLDGLGVYDKNIKDYIENHIDSDQYIKSIDDTSTITLDVTDGKLTAGVKGDVVVDADYATVKLNATAGKNADTALRSFLGNPDGYPDNNIPEYSKTVQAAADAKAAAIDAKDSALNSANAAAASAQTAADILGTSADAANKNTVYGVYAKVNNRVTVGLDEINGEVEDGIRTLTDKEDEIRVDLDKYVIDDVHPDIADYVETTTKPTINAYVDDVAKPGIVDYVDNTTKPSIDAYVNNTAKSDIYTYVNNTIKPDIDNYVTADVTNDINDVRDAAIIEVNKAMTPVTAAKNDAEAAKNAAVVAKDAAEAAANTATNAVTGFRAELGDRNGEINTVWDNIRTLKSSVEGGVHFKGVFSKLPQVIDDDDRGIGAWIDGDFIGFATGDVIIVTNVVDALSEPTKEYILSLDGDSIPRWVELGDVSPADQKITSLENSKLNKSALVSTEDTVSDLESNYTFAFVELTADGHAVVRLDTIIDAIPTSDIDALFA